MKNTFRPFKNESQTFMIGGGGRHPDDRGLTVENRLDRVSLYGSLEITRDKEGLKRLFELRVLLKDVFDALKDEDIPDKISVLPEEDVRNPFR